MGKFRKAFTGALVGGLTVLQLSTQTTSEAGETIAGGEWRNAIIAALLAGLAVYEVPNDPDPA